MKIAHLVEHYHPSTGGMQEVVRQISETLVKSGENLTVYTSFEPTLKSHSINGVKIKSFKIYGNLATGIAGEESEFIDDLLNSKFDIITLFAAQQWTTDLVLKNIDKFKGKSKIVFVPTGFSGYFREEYKKYFSKMKNWIKKTDANVFLSDDYRDINFARENKAKNIVIIPNGAGEKEFLGKSTQDVRKKLGIKNNSRILLHVGSHTGLKGHWELIKIFNKLLTKDLTLVIQGNGKGVCLIECKIRARIARFFGKDIRALNLGRTDTIDLFKQSDLFVFPSNIECSPIVLFEAAAAKLPFVCTDVGNSKEIIRWLGSGELLPTYIDKSGYSHADIKRSATLIDQLLSNKRLLENYSANGYRNWLKKFTWVKISSEYENLYKKILSK